MKKILSVALFTAMAFSMFASVAFGDDALNTQQKFDVLKEKVSSLAIQMELLVLTKK